jgi:phosphomannomutase
VAKPGENLTPLDIVKYASAYAAFIQWNTSKTVIKIVVGRDSRISGDNG